MLMFILLHNNLTN